MEMVLTLAGIGCIIAAIVGGGIKIKDIVEMGTVGSLWRQVLLAVFGCVLLYLGSGSGLLGPYALKTNAPGLSSEAGDAPSITGEGSSAHALPLTIQNECPENVRIELAYKSREGWTNRGGAYWIYAPFERNRMMLNEEPLLLMSGDVYVFARGLTSGKEWSGSYEFDGSARLRQFRLTPENGEYTLPLICG